MADDTSEKVVLTKDALTTVLQTVDDISLTKSFNYELPYYTDDNSTVNIDLGFYNSTGSTKIVFPGYPDWQDGYTIFDGTRVRYFYADYIVQTTDPGLIAICKVLYNKGYLDVKLENGTTVRTYPKIHIKPNFTESDNLQSWSSYAKCWNYLTDIQCTDLYTNRDGSQVIAATIRLISRMNPSLIGGLGGARMYINLSIEGLINAIGAVES